MNSYFDQAEIFIAQEVGSDFGIVEESIQDLPAFYSFIYQSRKYLETGEFADMAVGQGHNFISKLDNRVFSYGSGCGFEEALKELQKKITQEAEIKKTIPAFDIQKRFDLNVKSVTKRQLLSDALLKNGLTYVIPQIAGGSIFRVPKSYTRNLLSERLTDLPLRLRGLNQNELPELIIELVKNSSCAFDVLEHEEKNLAQYVDRATENDLKPIW